MAGDKTIIRAVTSSRKDGLVGGGALAFRIESLSKSDAKAVVGKKVTVVLKEIDSGSFRDRASGKSEDKLATFEATVREVATVMPGRFHFEKPSRVDAAEKLPEPEKRRLAGGPVAFDANFEPEWKPPHLTVGFDIGEFGIFQPIPVGIVLIKGDKREREGYIYEIAFDVMLGKKTIFKSSRKSPTRLDCVNLLMDNCRTAMLKEHFDHIQLSVEREVGLFYGTKFEGDFSLPGARTALPDLWNKFTADKKKYTLQNSNCVKYQIDTCKLGHRKSLAGPDWSHAFRHYIAAQARKRRHKQLSTVQRTRSRPLTTEETAFLGNREIGGSGTHIYNGLMEIGWRGLYFNPDTKRPLDSEPYHIADAAAVKRTNVYRRLRVIDSILDFAPSKEVWDKAAEAFSPVAAADRTPKKDSDKIKALDKIPFALIIFKGASHTALVSLGFVHEVHWRAVPWVDKDGLDDMSVFTNVPLAHYTSQVFEKTKLAEYPWRDGMILVPPGQWDPSAF